MTETIDTRGVIVVDDTSSLLVRRPFSYYDGDARRLDFGEAVAYAAKRFHRRGCRQQVRREYPSLYMHEITWLIQDIS